jgi:hypothetical protein
MKQIFLSGARRLSLSQCPAWVQEKAGIAGIASRLDCVSVRFPPAVLICCAFDRDRLQRNPHGPLAPGVPL